MMLSKDELLDKMVNIKNNRNYKNMLLFPTLEGFTDNQIPTEVMKNSNMRKFFHPGTADILQPEDSDSKFYDPNNPSKTRGSRYYMNNNNGSNDKSSKGVRTKQTKYLNNDQTSILDDLNTFIKDEINTDDVDLEDIIEDILDDVNIPDEIPVSIDDLKNIFDLKNFNDYLLGIQNIVMFFISFFNNILIYFSIVITQLSYGNLPITPFGNISASIKTPNWPWKLDLNVSTSDNIVTNPTATIIKPTDGPVLIGNTYIPASVYSENQKILYDSSIIYGVFTQIILVIVTWVFTNNAYYYIYYDSTNLPLRVISPENITEDGVVEVKKGSLVLYTICNTFFASPYDILLYAFKGIKWVTKQIDLYNFPALLYILLFMIILYFNLTYFWDLYNSFIQNPFEWVQDPFFLSFLVYGVIRHYLLVATITNFSMGPSIVQFITWCLYNLLIILLISGILYEGYPIMRIVFYIWFIYIFLGFYGFSSNTYEDIIKHENKKCESNVFKIGTFIRNAVVYFFSYFFYFVLFVLIISNFIYLGTNPMKNSNSSSAIKLFLSILFLFAFMYLVYYILNKKSYKSNNSVEYGESYVNKDDLSSRLDQKMNNVNIVKTDPTTTIPSKENEVKPVTPNLDLEVKNQFLAKLLQDIIILKKIGASSLFGGNQQFENFEKKIKEVDNIYNDISDIFQSPISIQKVEQGIETKLLEYNGQYKDKIELVLSFLKEIILMKIDTNISNFCNRVVNIIKISSEKLKQVIKEKEAIITELKNNIGKTEEPDETKEPDETEKPDEKEEINNLLQNNEFMTEIQKAYNEEIVVIQTKFAEIIKRNFQPETQIAISITQIYNSGFAFAFTEAQPEIGFFCYIVTQLYPKETKAGLRNTIRSVASIGYNSVKSKFGFGSKPATNELPPA